MRSCWGKKGQKEKRELKLYIISATLIPPDFLEISFNATNGKNWRPCSAVICSDAAARNLISEFPWLKKRRPVSIFHRSRSEPLLQVTLDRYRLIYLSSSGEVLTEAEAHVRVYNSLMGHGI